MRTDTLFYQLFQSFHSLLFELIERPISEAKSYEFSSVEVKEKAFRFDGIFSPREKNKPIYLLEVQFQPKEDFYWEYLSEIYLYLNQYRPEQEWQAIAIFAKRSYEPELRSHVEEMISCQRLQRVYLEDLIGRETNSLGIGIIQLILAPESQAVAIAKQLGERIDQETDPEIQDSVVELIETVLVYKFPKLSRQEIEAMFTYSDLKQTRVYQDARQEGEQSGEQRGIKLGEQRGIKLGEQKGLAKGQSTMLLRMLNHKFGQLTPRLRGRISKLSVKQLESLAEAVFDLETIADLNNWLLNNAKEI
jgi:predicted transposase/invertase (TIGR01784 family)